MHTPLRTLLLASLISISFGTIAQPVATDAAAPPTRCMQDGERPSSHRQKIGHDKDRAAQRLASLKTQLALEPQQEAAWQTFTAVLGAERLDHRSAREDLAKLSTPARLDKLQELRKQRETKLNELDAATRTFYSQLKPEQQAKFDDSSRRFWRGPRS